MRRVHNKENIIYVNLLCAFLRGPASFYSFRFLSSAIIRLLLMRIVTAEEVFVPVC